MYSVYLYIYFHCQILLYIKVYNYINYSSECVKKLSDNIDIHNRHSVLLSDSPVQVENYSSLFMKLNDQYDKYDLYCL